MTKQRSNLLAGLLVVALVAAMAIPAAAGLTARDIKASTGVSIYVDDQKLDPRNAGGSRVEAFVSDGTTYLPIRALGSALGKDIGWDGTSATAYVSGVAADPKAAEYLEAYFGIAPFSGTVTRAAFDAALEKLGAAKTGGTGALSVAEAVKACVKAAGLEELALTYTRDSGKKAGDRLAAYGLSGVAESYAPYVAAALDADLAYATYDFAAQPDAGVAAQLLMNAVNISGQGRNYLGMASDPDIYAKIQSAWATFGNFDDEKLSQLGADLVISEASTGYNLKYDGYNANFLPKYTLQYGHSDITHAVQLIALLNSEGIDARVQLEPKTSIYEYMVDWGDPAGLTMTPTYEVKPIEGGRYLCYATEYDMKLEFNSVEDKNQFDGVVNTYCKKWLDKVDAEGVPTESLLYGAWFQPLYTSTVPMADAESFTHIKDNVIHNGPYSIHPFSTVDGGDAIAKVVKEKAPDLSVEPVDLYVNNAFYRYLIHEADD